MEVFFGGQIKESKRGDDAVIISHPKDKPSEYNLFLYPIKSEEFIHLTGMGIPNNPLDRIYIGVSGDAGRELAGMSDELRDGLTNLKKLDNLVVHSYFLRTRN